MTISSRIAVCLLASGAFVVGPSLDASYAEPVANEVMLINAKTGKCLTIAGGVSTDNNVPALQFDCDSDLSRRWTIRLKLQ
jgi:cytolethal distending toxin subunit A